MAVVKRQRSRLTFCVLGAVWCVHSLVGLAATTRISISSDGVQANGYSSRPTVSADGRYVAFDSFASNLVASDTNGCRDVFVHDTQTGETICVSSGLDGAPGDSDSARPSMTPDGRYLAFQSSAANLVADDTNEHPDIFVYDRLSGQLQRLDIAIDGWHWEPWESPPYPLEPVISDDGRYVACLYGYGRGGADTLIHDRETGISSRVSVATDGTRSWSDGPPAMTSDARFVAFVSEDAYLTPEDGYTAGFWQNVFVHDRDTGETTRVSIATDGAAPDADCDAPAVSADGRYVVFVSRATSLVPGVSDIHSHLFLRDRQTGETTLLDIGLDGDPANHDSCSSAYQCGPPAITGDACYVAFYSCAGNLVPGTPVNETGIALLQTLYVRDRFAAKTSCVTICPDATFAAADWPALSPDGRYVAFESSTSNLVPGDTNEVGDIFLRDRLTFPDVSFDHWAFYEVGGCVQADIVQGYHDGLYRPDCEVTRDQMAVYIARALAGGDVYIPTGPAQATFPDVPTDHWAYDYIEYAAANHVVLGYDDGSYQPDWVVRRGQMAVYIARSVVTPTGEAGLEGWHPPAAATFPDVAFNYWCYKHIEYCAAHGIVAGYPDGSYQPALRVTRDQMAVYIQRAFELPL